LEKWRPAGADDVHIYDESLAKKMMLKQQVYLILCLCTAVTTAPNPNLDGDINGNCKDKCITLESLLCEMADRDRLAQFPTPEYESLQYSSYNRNSVPSPGSPGWFADSDGTQCIRTEFINGQKEWVIMEHDGPGCITTLWTPFFYYGYSNRVGPHIKVYLDGSDTPVIDETFIELVTHNEWLSHYGSAPAKRNSFEFPEPFAGFTARAGNLYFPIPFAQSCKVTTDKKNFYFHLNYRTYPPNVKVKSFTMADYYAVLPTMAGVGNTLLNPPAFSGGTELTLNQVIAAGNEATMTLPAGNAAVRHLEITLQPNNVPTTLRSTVLQMTFDGEQTVWAPVGDFFCNVDENKPIKPFNTWSRSVDSNGVMTCRWVMPYESSGEIKLINLSANPVTADMIVRVGDWTWDDQSMHFHANWRIDDPVPGTPFLDWNFIDISGKGVFLADVWTVLSPGTGWWGEGDEKIYIDNDYDVDQFPSHFGTGTEDYYGWAGGVNPTGADEFSAPFLSNVRVGNPANPRGYNINTRDRVLDAIPFKNRLRFDMEASPGTGIRNPWNLLAYSVVTYWYGRPGLTHNRPPLPYHAAAPILTLEQIDAMQDELRGNTFYVPGAIEFENQPTWQKTPGLVAEKEVIPPTMSPSQWSNGAQRLVESNQVGDFIEFRFTNQFSTKNVTLYIAQMSNYGIIRISVNGQVVGSDIDTYAPLPNVKEPIDIGNFDPLDNAILLRFELVGQNPSSGGTHFGLDCVVISNPGRSS